MILALIGPLLNPPALVRWDVQIMEQDELRAVLGLIGIRHLPIFLLALVLGHGIFQLLRSTGADVVIAAVLPYLLYLVAHGVYDSLSTGEPPFSWVSYEPAIFIWPHFIAAPLGLVAAAIRVARLRRLKAATKTHS
ncbi:MAG: hypothetical protein O9318_06835 [Hylemonella sp.]|uniref:hypothetical protein n=1 Tax=Hylemonella sp. TaxID=2066020 RepID=UPI0022C27FE7|nr:hypothetical protein [Hylemonella sp.]MCZ8252167.1 hypothetical protein [Hylemonella sp.]